MACAERPDKTQQSLTFSVSATGGLKQVNYSASVQGGKPPPPLSGILHFEAVSERSLTWSEEMRKSIEAQIAAAPKIEETLLTFHCTVEKGRARMWVNGRFVFEIPLEAEFDPSGVVKVQVAAGAELASARVSADTYSGRFTPPSRGI